MNCRIVSAMVIALMLSACSADDSAGPALDVSAQEDHRVDEDSSVEVVGKECLPGSSKCLGATQWACNAEGTGWVDPQECGAGEICAGDACCLPTGCEGKECGDDGCGTSCGDCPAGFDCHDGLCLPGGCEPNCGDNGCGADGCGGSCGECEEPDLCCMGECCQGDCEAKECGDDDCCGSCGECGDGAVCLDNACCEFQCEGKSCGNDGCGGLCGECAEGIECIDGVCCTPQCEGKECGPDGCGGQCGYCEPWFWCSGNGQCENVCTESCTGKWCGPDICGGLCGTCPEMQMCTDAGECANDCNGDCQGKQCGTDGCGQPCGAACPLGTYCDVQGLCQPDAACLPNCKDRECGPDGCGAECGECPEMLLCTVEGHCGGYCAGCEFDELCGNLNFEQGNLVGWSIEGDGRVVHNLAATEAPQGFFMGLVSSSFGKIGRIMFANCILQDQAIASVSMKLKVYSEEFLEWCGSAFQDKVLIYLQIGIETRTVFEAEIKDFCPPDVCAGCGNLYEALEAADIVLDQGDVQMTPWFDVEGDVLGFVSPGEMFYLMIMVSDGQDAMFDTLVLVDDIVFNYCQPECEGKQCGDNGCGGQCGGCLAGETCVDDLCVCVASCDGKACGDDGCGQSCGDCGPGFACQDGQCVVCEANCMGKACGPDGCGGSCGNCDDGYYCSPQNVCLLECTPDCEGKDCGDDGCGGNCGDCEDSNPCTNDKCNPTYFMCNYLFVEAPCDDGNPETENDHCVEGECVGEGP